jgi:hypothetical protein
MEATLESNTTPVATSRCGCCGSKAPATARLFVAAPLAHPPPPVQEKRDEPLKFRITFAIRQALAQMAHRGGILAITPSSLEVLAHAMAGLCRTVVRVAQRTEPPPPTAFEELEKAFAQYVSSKPGMVSEFIDVDIASLNSHDTDTDDEAASCSGPLIHDPSDDSGDERSESCLGSETWNWKNDWTLGTGSATTRQHLATAKEASKWDQGWHYDDDDDAHDATSSWETVPSGHGLGVHSILSAVQELGGNYYGFETVENPGAVARDDLPLCSIYDDRTAKPSHELHMEGICATNCKCPPTDRFEFATRTACPQCLQTQFYLNRRCPNIPHGHVSSADSGAVKQLGIDPHADAEDSHPHFLVTDESFWRETFDRKAAWETFDRKAAWEIPEHARPLAKAMNCIALRCGVVSALTRSAVEDLDGIAKKWVNDILHGASAMCDYRPTRLGSDSPLPHLDEVDILYSLLYLWRGEKITQVPVGAFSLGCKPSQVPLQSADTVPLQSADTFLAVEEATMNPATKCTESRLYLSCDELDPGVQRFKALHSEAFRNSAMVRQLQCKLHRSAMEKHTEVHAPIETDNASLHKESWRQIISLLASPRGVPSLNFDIHPDIANDFVCTQPVEYLVEEIVEKATRNR